jgi:hypothetical protein
MRYIYSNLEGDDNYEHLEWKCINEKRRHWITAGVARQENMVMCCVMYCTTQRR